MQTIAKVKVDAQDTETKDQWISKVDEDQAAFKERMIKEGAKSLENFTFEPMKSYETNIAGLPASFEPGDHIVIKGLPTDVKTVEELSSFLSEKMMEMNSDVKAEPEVEEEERKSPAQVVGEKFNWKAYGQSEFPDAD